MRTLISYIELQSWSFMRMLRIVIGAAILYQGINDSEWLLAGLGGIFLLQGVLNAGCGACAANSCEVKR